MAGTPDSTDPGNTYTTWDFTRLYAMPLMTYKSCPGACGLQVYIQPYYGMYNYAVLGLK